ncbi:hypothetical protein [Kitasatospora sp. NPDC047058]|uniref:hypothetical protein n=1 Tax=Kitasatospora sp. NPDC047058 TaxID=3155620 RepID=UPI0034007B86
MGNDGAGTGFSAHPEKRGDAGGPRQIAGTLTMSGPAVSGEYVHTTSAGCAKTGQGA